MGHALHVKILNESGYDQALFGVSLNKDQKVEKMDKVCKRLAPLDSGHNKFLEHIVVWLDVRTTRYLWQEMDTFRLSSKNSQSTMHTIMKNELVQDNFELPMPEIYIDMLNALLDGDMDKIKLYKHLRMLKTKGLDLGEKNTRLMVLKSYLPEGFLQRRMWKMSYKTLRNIILQRRNHRLPHWHTFVQSVLAQVKNPELLPPYTDQA